MLSAFSFTAISNDTTAVKPPPKIGLVLSGGGLPMSHYLPNGWNLVFSSNVLLDAEKNHIEGGIKPDFEAEIGDDYKTTRKDGVVEKALDELIKKI